MPAATRLLRLLAVLLVAWGALAGPARAGAVIRAAPAVDAEAALAPPPAPPPGWETRPGTYARVHAPPAEARTALRVLRHAATAVPRLAAEMGVAAGPPIDIYVVPDARLFAEMQPGPPPAWADATAWPARGLVYLRAPRLRRGDADPLEQVLDHEIVHVLLGRAFGPRPVPRWLQEGLAQVLAREYRRDTLDTLARGSLAGALPGLDEITRGFPEDPVRAHLAYAESADLVAFLRERWGSDGLAVLVREMAAGHGAQAALRAATGMAPGEFERAWRARLRRSPLWLEPLTGDGALFGAAAVLLVAGWFGVRRRRRRTLERWSREEAAWDEIERELARPRWWSADDAPLSR